MILIAEQNETIDFCVVAEVDGWELGLYIASWCGAKVGHRFRQADVIVGGKARTATSEVPLCGACRRKLGWVDSVPESFPAIPGTV